MESKLLDSINSIEDLKRIKESDLPELCNELRSYMIETVLQTGGHLASSLGAVELIVAIHYVFSSPQDKIVFDVGHQAYAHKILTGRREQFRNLRQEDGISGFPKRNESIHDVFNTGHASTAVSAMLGFARAMKLKGENGTAVALVGDGAMTGGLTFEALDDIANDKLPVVIVLNDNEMSISKNVGGLTQYFASMRTGKLYNAFKQGIVHTLETSTFGKWLSKHLERTKNRIKHFLIPNLPFEDLGFTYIGPIDGHDVKKMITYLRRVRSMKKPIILHTITRKGKGYPPAEMDPEYYHGISSASCRLANHDGAPQTCSQVFGQSLCELAKEDKRIVGITAAMPTGTGLTDFAKFFPDRFFDVGIAEEHAITMAAALAAGGIRPVVAIYSSFLQRAYDQLLHDVCLQNLPVVIGVDRSGLVGEDGETHQGIYDSAFLMTMPYLVIYSPGSLSELRAMLKIALKREEPAAIRYNRGTMLETLDNTEVIFGKWSKLKELRSVTLFATGAMLPLALKIASEHQIGLVNMRFLKPLDTEMLDECVRNGTKILVLEDSITAVAKEIALYCNKNIVHSISIPGCPVTQGTILQQRDRFGLNEKEIIKRLQVLEEL